MNPFAKRATELYRDDVAFLPVVSPEPLIVYFAPAAEEDVLFDRLVTVIGTPGSGKTTMARLFQLPALRAVLRQSDTDTYRPLLDALTQCRAIADDRPAVSGFRLPLEAEYRDFWELPYKEDVKFNLMCGLLQARAMLGWLRNLEASDVRLENVRIVPKGGTEAATRSIGGTEGPDLLARAQEVEQAIYRISAALVAPNVNGLEEQALSAYRPFNVVTEIVVQQGTDQFRLRPLVMFDDAHSLHQRQFDRFLRWLIQRELAVSRWVLSRLDAMSPEGVLIGSKALVAEDVNLPGVQRGREIKIIALQGGSLGDSRSMGRRAFRRMAKDMANRYLAQMPTFSRKRVTDFTALLQSAPEAISAPQLSKLAQSVDTRQDKLAVSDTDRAQIEKQIKVYLSGADTVDVGEDVKLAMLKILMARYAARRPQVSLFSDDNERTESRPVTADSGVAEGARLHLLHEFKRPFFYGIETLCDAGSENAEQFLQLAADLVDRSETLIIRDKNFTLPPRVQHQLLRDRADAIIAEWNFPLHPQVRMLCDAIGRACIDRSLQENAPLGAGANGVAILEEDFARIPDSHEALARVLQFGVAYNAFSLVRNRAFKDRKWCVVELSGVVLIHFGLTLQRGGVVEWDLRKLIESSGAST